MVEDRFKGIFPILVLFLIGSAVFSIATKSYFWFLAPLAGILIICALSKVIRR